MQKKVHPVRRFGRGFKPPEIGTLSNRVKTPLREETIKELRSGDIVEITGYIYTVRDAAHKRFVELIKNTEPLPFDLKGAVIYYVGPTPPPPGEIIGSAGPTTSFRMDPYTPLLLQNGLKGIIGKGQRSQEVKDALIKYKGVYFATTGGAGAFLSRFIKSSEIIAYEELTTEAVRLLYVEDFPAIVANDIYGGDLFEEGKRKYQIK